MEVFCRCKFLSTDYCKRSAGHRCPETGICITYV